MSKFSVRAEGIPFVLAALVLSGILVVVFKPFAPVFLLVSLFFAWFFRDPPRESPPSGIIAPADGKVVDIEQVEPPFSGNFVKVGIFMSPFDVHVTRAPLSGKVVAIKGEEGGFRRAYLLSASRANLRRHILIEGDEGKVVVSQVAGAVARRIRTYVKEGDRVERGQRIGIIMFGSRVDTWLPGSFRIKVKVGDKVKGGETVLACSGG